MLIGVGCRERQAATTHNDAALAKIRSQEDGGGGLENGRPALKAIFDRYGVPTYDMVGVQAAKDFVVMVQHQAPALRIAVLPKLKANVERAHPLTVDQQPRGWPASCS